MLNRLKIHNVALIDKSDIEFDAGFSALTGETGAGKSILIESVGFILGDRASRDSIRTGAAKASVEAEFTLSEDSPALAFLRDRALEDELSLVVYRELSVNGRNVCRINGTMVSASELKDLGTLLVDLHGQHAHQSLLDATTHLRLIDAFSKDPAHLIDRLEQTRAEALRLQREWKQLQSSLSQRMQRIDMLRFQKAEIDRFDPRDGEEEELDTRRNVLQNAETITDGLNTSYDAIFGDGGVLASLSEAKTSLSKIGRYDSAYADLANKTEEAYYELEDVAYALRDARSSFSYDPEELDRIESRLAALQNLKRKYGASIREILAYRDRIAEELELLLDGDQQAEAKEQAFRKACAEFESIAIALSKQRKEAATSFREVPASQLSETGIDEAEFLLSANRGEPVKPLAKVASGGEISRIMLALKIALSDADRIDTMIFDEIDTGISGLIANTVAKKMRELSKRRQVLCVTHLPQIAAHADVQYVVNKISDETSTRSSTHRLSEEERPAELARIMGSKMDDAEAIAHAKRLLSEAKQNNG